MMLNRHGFTLIELMVVLTIIGILASFGIPKMQKQLLKGHLEDAKPYLMLIASRMRTYKKEYGQYDKYIYIDDHSDQEMNLSKKLGIDLKDASNFCFIAITNNMYYTNSLKTDTNFEIWAIIRDKDNKDPKANIRGDLTCFSGEEKNPPEDWSIGHAGKTIVLRYPPGSNGPQSNGTDTIHDWVNGISIYNAVKD